MSDTLLRQSGYDRAPDDADGLLVPAPRGEAALDHARRLTAVATELGETAALLDEVRGLLGGWSGPAAAAFEVRRVDVVGELARLADDVAVGAGVLAGFGTHAPPAAAAMRAAREGIEAARRERALAEAANRYWTPGIDARERRAWDGWDRAKADYGHAVTAVRSGLRRLIPSLPDRRPSAGDHLVGLVGRFARLTVLDPATATWSSLVAAVRDPVAAAQSRVEAWMATLAALRHPVDLVADSAWTALDGDAWSRGRYGEGVGAVAALVVGRWSPEWERLPALPGSPDPGARVRYARWAVPDAPLPPRQSLPDLLRRVDLDAHEHARLGHTLSRHVGRTDAYLVDRLRVGTVLEDGRIGPRPTSASTFTDRETAETAITRALVARRDLVETCAATRVCPPVQWQADRPLGRVVRPEGGGFVVAPGDVVTVVLGVRDGVPYIRTAYLLASGPGRPLAVTP